MAEDGVFHITKVETRTYRNEKLGRWIEEAFKREQDRTVAWLTAFQIGRMYPEVEDKIRGELIDEDIQEES